MGNNGIFQKSLSTNPNISILVRFVTKQETSFTWLSAVLICIVFMLPNKHRLACFTTTAHSWRRWHHINQALLSLSHSASLRTNNMTLPPRRWRRGYNVDLGPKCVQPVTSIINGVSYLSVIAHSCSHYVIDWLDSMSYLWRVSIELYYNVC